ncbi:hypothetical protein MNBD_GAMMA04-1790 [hydrothermal vent metagenome]|uniref:Uncharacterized protein n=1 Tax=hydrothermal vent metagenome TaxID=652676 RepID=A0A3B0WGY2_9ZZZZ
MSEQSTTQMARLVITGLPGSGKTQVIQSLPSSCLSFPEKTVNVVEVNGLNAIPPSDLMWCVIDVRSSFVAGRDDWLEVRLKALVKQADGIVFSFLENAALDEQTAWSQWVARYAKGVPVVRWLNQTFPAHFSPEWAGFQASKPVAEQGQQNALSVIKSGRSGAECLTKEQPTLQTFHFNVERLSLEHLLFGLGGCPRMKVVTRESHFVAGFVYI